MAGVPHRTRCSVSAGGVPAAEPSPPIATKPERLVDIKLVLDTLSAVADSHVASMADALAVAALSQDVQALDWGSMKPLLAAIQERFGPAVVWYAQPDGSYYTVDLGLTDKNLKERAYFPKVMAGETAIGELVISQSTGTNTVIVAVPIMAQGKVVGAFGGLGLSGQAGAEIQIYRQIAGGSGLLRARCTGTHHLALPGEGF